MVSIVIVSHSAKLAQGVCELAQQMVQGKVAIAVAAGIDDPENPIGTDAMQVYQAIESVYDEDGVLVLMDLGSALLSAEMAIEFLLPEQQTNIYLCEAPFVEGTLAAAVQASVGASIEQVMAEARGALAAKVAQLRPQLEVSVSEPSGTTIPSADWQALRLTIRNRLGLHARPAARFVSAANRFAADMVVEKKGRTANAKSINQVATLGVRQGDEIVIRATGADAGEALAAIQALSDENFGESEAGLLEPAATGQKPALPQAKGEVTGIPVSPGIAIGPVFLYRPRVPEIKIQKTDNPPAEWNRLEEAVDLSGAEINALYEVAIRQVGPAEAAIFEAHLLFLQDPALLDAARERILGQQLTADAAWSQAIDEMAAAYRALDDPYMQARAVDVLDVGRRVLAHLLELEQTPPEFERPSILVAADLTPSDTAGLDPERVLGLCTELGGATSHSAILARALGIPAIVGLGPILADLADGQVIAMDGTEGRLWPTPGAERLAELRQDQARWLEARQQAKAASLERAVTLDGHTLEIAANIGRPYDAVLALEYGAEGVGLFRTEFLFLDRQTAPSEEEQFEAYRQVAETMGDRPVIIRTLDVGGDKPLSYLDLGREENPFLGWRGIRFCLDRPEIFKPQLRAILRAGNGYKVKLMFPMIGTVAELIGAKALLAEAQDELAAEGIPFDHELEVGIMIEVPAAVAVADLLAAEADFFSIGTNDLTQYVMAADRGNTQVAGLANALQPAVLRMIRQTVEAAHEAGIWVGMCGELAGNPLAAAVLVGLGLDELSMSAPAIPEVKKVIRGLTCEQARQIAVDVLQLESVGAVSEYLASS